MDTLVRVDGVKEMINEYEKRKDVEGSLYGEDSTQEADRASGKPKKEASGFHCQYWLIPLLERLDRSL